VTLGDALTNTTTTATGLDDNTSYEFRVWAYNGDSIAADYVTSASTTTADATSPTAVADLAAKTGTTQENNHCISRSLNIYESNEYES